MLLHTSETAPARAAFKRKEAQREQLKNWIEYQTANSVYLDDPKSNPADALARVGKPMRAEEVEKRLKKLNPSLVFEWNEFNSSKKMIYQVDSRGKTALFPYESGLMPERSIMSTKEEFVPVDEIFDNNDFRADRKDLGPVELIPGRGFVPKNGQPNPYMRRVLIPWREHTRGWRTVLIKLVMAGAITPHQAESVFGAADNPEWQNSMGKAKHHLPW